MIPSKTLWSTPWGVCCKGRNDTFIEVSHEVPDRE